MFLCMCVHMSACKCMWMCISTRVWRSEVNMDVFLNHSPLSFFLIGSPTEFGAHQFSEDDCLID